MTIFMFCFSVVCLLALGGLERLNSIYMISNGKNDVADSKMAA